MLLTFIPYPLRRSVGGADTDSSKSGFQSKRPKAARAAAQGLYSQVEKLGTGLIRLRGVWHSETSHTGRRRSRQNLPTLIDEQARVDYAASQFFGPTPRFLND